MIYVVGLDPASIHALTSAGSLGEDQLVGIFEALLQNCMIAETTDWRVGMELAQAVKGICDTGIRKRVISILETLAAPNQRNRLVEVIDSSANALDAPLTEILSSQIENPELDAIICESPSSSVKIVSALRFNSSDFARDRSRSACAIIYAPRAMKAQALLKEAFGRLARHAGIIEIYDRQMGKTFSDSYFEAIPQWCTFFKALGRNFEIVVHTTDSQANGVRGRFQAELADSKVGLKVIEHSEIEQPHDRFLRTCHFTLDIGRGIDLFDRNGDCRDVKIGLSNHGEFTKQWRHLSLNLP